LLADAASMAHANLLHEIQASGLTTLQEIATASMLAAFTRHAAAGGIRRPFAI
jgi:hypothetical protein